MKMSRMNVAYAGAGLLGLAAVGWVAWGFVGTSPLALVMTLVIGAVYLYGAWELRQFRSASAGLRQGLESLAGTSVVDLDAWLARLPAPLQPAVRQRIQGERVGLPGPTLTPYLVGLLVMLGMLGTFLGMVVTFKGAVFALEGSAELEAIRAALSAPIRGLSLSFGTSVAGVAASAMLGLMAALARRERLGVVRLLDAAIRTSLRAFSAAQQRDELMQTLHSQAQALPRIAEHLQALMDGLERRHQALDDALLARQEAFHQAAASAYTGLAEAVGRSLEQSLTASADMAGQTIRPVVQQAMADMVQSSQLAHQRLADLAQTQLQGLSAQWAGTVQTVSATWEQAVGAQAQTNEALVTRLDATLQDVTRGFDVRTTQLLEAWKHAAHQAQQASAQAAEQLLAAQTKADAARTASQAHAETQRLQAQAQADAQRLAQWQQGLHTLSDTLASHWQHATEQAAAQQQAMSQTLVTAAGQVTQTLSERVEQAVARSTGLLAQAETLVQTRLSAEDQWQQGQRERMAQLSHIWQTELAALRDQEAAQAHAAVERLDALQAAAARHLADLGAALEAPLTRLLHTASEVPQAAAQVIAQLRQEMTVLAERDNTALAERQAMVQQLGDLIQTLAHAGNQQREAVAQLVQQATGVLAQASEQFAQALQGQAGRVEEVAAHVSASAVELSALGEAFSHGVGLFAASNDQLVHSLQRIESAMGQTLQRSDDQLAYYVAQAREVIDLSMASQQSMVDDLRRLHSQGAAAPGVPA